MQWFANKIARHVLVPCALVLASTYSAAQSAADYPTRPVRIVVVTAPGGGLDIVGRLVAERLSRRLGQTVIIDNRPGAGGNIASELVSRATADGYTLLETTNNHNINSFLFKNPGYDPRKDFAAVIQLTEAPSILVANPKSPYNDFKDVVAAAKTQPGKISYGHAGSGQGTHIAAEMFVRAAKIQLTAIPYKGGGPANQAVIAGQIPLAMSALPAVTAYIKEGRLRPLGVTSAKRWPTLPTVPAIAEEYPNVSHLTWIGIIAPTGTPEAIVTRLNRDIAGVLADSEFRERILALGAAPVGKSPADFEAMLKAEYEITRKLVMEIGLKAD